MISGSRGLPTWEEEEEAFLVYHVCQGFQLLDMLKMFNQKFSKDLKSRKCISFLENMDDGKKRALLLAAKSYEWFKPDAPEYYDFSLPCITSLSSESWPMEQRAYILHFQARGIMAKKIHENFNNRYRPERTLGAINHELTFLNSKPELAKLLRHETPKFSWWKREPVKGEKEWAAMDRRRIKVEAYARKKAHVNRFKGIEQEAAAASVREEEEGEIFGDEDEGEASFSSPPPLQPSTPMHHPSSSSSQHPPSPNQSRQTPSPSSYLDSSSPAGAPPTPKPTTASPALAISTGAGEFSDECPDDLYYDENAEDPFTKPFHSPDDFSPSFGAFSPTSYPARGSPLSVKSPLPSSASAPSGGMPSASRTASSPAYCYPPRNPPFDAGHGFPPAPIGHPLGASGHPYNYYSNPAHFTRTFGSFSPHDPPASFSSTPYSPGPQPTSFSLGAPPPPRRPAPSNPWGPPSSHAHPERQADP